VLIELKTSDARPVIAALCMGALVPGTDWQLEALKERRETEKG
jgi:hypothetical protein